MLIFISFSSIQLAIDNPLNDPSLLTSKILNVIDYFLTGIFILEVIFKIISFGFLFCGTSSYLRQQLNILDLFIVAVSVSFLILTNFPLDYFVYIRDCKLEFDQSTENT